MRVARTTSLFNITNQSSDGAVRFWIWSSGFSYALLGLLIAVSTIQLAALSVEANQTIDRIEEDWELVVTSPDAGTTAPQVTCVISPTGNLSSTHATIELNHHTQPEYEDGGVHLQVWNGNLVGVQVFVETTLR